MPASIEAPPTTPRRTRIELWVLVAAILVAAIFVLLFVRSMLTKSDLARVAATNASAQIVIAMLKNYNLEYGFYPKTLADLVPKYLEKTPLDAWRNPFLFTTDSTGELVLSSYGADGLPGGTGDAADLSWDARTGNQIAPK